VRKSEEDEHKLIAIEQEWRITPRHGWEEMTGKVYEVDRWSVQSAVQTTYVFQKLVRLNL